MIVNRPIHWAALKRFFTGEDSIFNNSKNKVLCYITAKLFRKLGFIPIDRETYNVSAARTMLQLLRIGRCIGIFPEGTTNKHPERQEVLEPKLGASHLAKMAGAWIQPISITWIPQQEDSFHNVIINFQPPYRAELEREQEQQKWKYAIIEGIVESTDKIDYRALEQLATLEES